MSAWIHAHSLPFLAGIALPPLELPGGYRLLNPEWLVALLAIPLILSWRRRRQVDVLVIPFAASWYRPAWVRRSRWALVCATIAAVLFVLGLARPQKIEDKREVRSTGYDIILTIDLSGSMLTEDYQRSGQIINRLQAVKPVIQAFINQRPHDRIGIVVFSGRAYTLAPLTFDHAWLARQTERLRVGLIEDGTAIGDGLGVALTRLEQADRMEQGQRKGAFIVLLTDGASNRGNLTPRQAAELAASRQIPIYTIGAGRMSLSTDLDEGTLHDVARATGGQYYRADDVNTVERAFNAIDRSRKIDFQAQSYYLTTELFPWCVVPAAVLLSLVAGLQFRRRQEKTSNAT